MEEIQYTTISSESDAHLLLAQALESANFDNRLQVAFDGWPSVVIKFEGEDFNGGIPSRMLESFGDLQKIIYRVYCQSAYGHSDIRRLTVSEKELLEFVVVPSEGSTDVLIDLAKVFSSIVGASNMSGAEVVTVIVATGILMTASVAWKNWLNYRRQQHADINLQAMSADETERLRIVTAALTSNPILQENNKDIDDFRASVARKLKEDDRMFISQSDEVLVDGKEAAKIVPEVRERSTDAHINGEFIISEVKTPRSAIEPFIITVVRASDNLTLRVEADSENLTMDQIAILKEGTFSLRKVVMTINAKVLRGSYSKAKLRSIDWPIND